MKFTHEGKVGINLYVIPEPSSGNGEGGPQMFIDDQSTVSANIPKEEKCLSPSQSSCTSKGSHTQNHALNDEPIDPINHDDSKQEDKENSHPLETTVWIRCDVYDTGIGIPGDFCKCHLFHEDVESYKYLFHFFSFSFIVLVIERVLIMFFLVV